MPKIRVAILMGGKSSEHSVSLVSGREVIKNLDKEKYLLFPVIISQSGDKWLYVKPRALLQVLSSFQPGGDLGMEKLRPEKIIDPFRFFKKENIDVVFISLHGPYGEDGTIQGMLDLIGVAYTGSGVAASAVGMNKLLFKHVVNSLKIGTPKHVLVSEINQDIDGVKKHLGDPPYFVKPANQGSSAGSSLVLKWEDLPKAVNSAAEFDDKVLVEEYIKGKEVTCAVWGNSEPEALPVIEIIPRGRFFDFESKYSEGGAQEIVARISPVALKIQEMSLEIYKTLGCRGFSRVDFILEGNKTPVVLEINTIPGHTPASLFPRAAAAAGYSYPQFLDKIITYALAQKG